LNGFEIKRHGQQLMFHERGQLFVGVQKTTLSVAMRVNNPDYSPVLRAVALANRRNGTSDMAGSAAR
jgi:hypothetical protein